MFAWLTESSTIEEDKKEHGVEEVKNAASIGALLPIIGAVPKQLSELFHRPSYSYGKIAELPPRVPSRETAAVPPQPDIPAIPTEGQRPPKASNTSVVTWDLDIDTDNDTNDVLFVEPGILATRSDTSVASAIRRISKSYTTRRESSKSQTVQTQPRDEELASTLSEKRHQGYWGLMGIAFAKKSIQKRKETLKDRKLLEEQEAQRQAILAVKQAEDKVKALNAAAKRTLRGFVERGKTDNKLTLSNFCKCLDVCDLKKYLSPLRASVWAAHQDENRKISVEYIVYILIDEMATDFVWWKDGAAGEGVCHKDPRVNRNSLSIRKKIADRAGVPIHEQKFDPIGSRLMVEGKLLGRTRARLDELDDCLEAQAERENEHRFRRELLISTKPGRGRISHDGEGGGSTNLWQLEAESSCHGCCLCADSPVSKASCRQCKRDQIFGKKTGMFEFKAFDYVHNSHMKPFKRPATLIKAKDLLAPED